jgi:hypothetical protein
MTEDFKQNFAKSIPFLMGFIGLGALAYTVYRELKNLDSLDVDSNGDPMLKMVFDEHTEDWS